MRTIVALLFVLAIVSAGELLGAENPNAIPGSYIVVMKEGITHLLRDAHVGDLLGSDVSNTLLHSYNSFVGFAAKLSPESLKAQLDHPDVAYIEVDQTMHASVIQEGATWGLDRIDQRNLPLNGEYEYHASAGEGVEVFVIDTGIYTENNDFRGRAKHGFNAFAGTESNTDLNGHGTHCAGTIGGATYGVAKEVTLIAVKVLNRGGSGSNAGVIAGVDYVTTERGKRSSTPMVASMSLGGGISSALDAAVESSIASGVVYVVAAGNEDQDACNSSPARVPSAVTVGASDEYDQRSYFSNWGKCVDIFAPGSDIESTWIGSKNAVEVISGTSMACPHVSGAIALHLGRSAKKTPAQAADWVVKQGTENVLSNCDRCGEWPEKTVNILLHSPK